MVNISLWKHLFSMKDLSATSRTPMFPWPGHNWCGINVFCGVGHTVLTLLHITWHQGGPRCLTETIPEYWARMFKSIVFVQSYMSLSIFINFTLWVRNAFCNKRCSKHLCPARRKRFWSPEISRRSRIWSILCARPCLWRRLGQRGRRSLHNEGIPVRPGPGSRRICLWCDRCRSWNYERETGSERRESLSKEATKRFESSRFATDVTA